MGPALVGCFSDFDCPPSHFSQWPKARACIAVLGQLIELGLSALDLRCRGIVKLGAVGRPLYVLRNREQLPTLPQVVNQAGIVLDMQQLRPGGGELR